MIRKAFISISVGALLSNFLIGCAVWQLPHTYETTHDRYAYQNPNKVQVQFYAPAGSTVTLGKPSKSWHLTRATVGFGRRRTVQMKDVQNKRLIRDAEAFNRRPSNRYPQLLVIPPLQVTDVQERIVGGGPTERDRTHQIGTYGDGLHKLEHEPEQFATFNLAPGGYEFKYTAEGWPDVTVYGEIEIHPVRWSMPLGVKDIVRRCFIPIALPSPATIKAVSASDDVFPYQSAARRLKISYQDIERLSAGDVLTKVVFVADLRKAKHERDRVEVILTNVVAERERVQRKLNEAKLDWLENPADKKDLPMLLGLKELPSKKSIRLQTELAQLDQVIRDANNKKARLEALLRADNVLIRREMLVMATDELLPKHEDPVTAAKELGQVLLVLRIGGRHLHWQ